MFLKRSRCICNILCFIGEPVVLPGNIALFENITGEDVTRLLSCLGITQKKYQKGEIVIAQGSVVDSIGIVVAGHIQISRNDYDGNRIILAEFGISSIFAESFVCAGLSRSPVSVVSTENSSIVFLPFARLMTSCESACSFHRQLIVNLIRLVAQKNLMLNSRLEVCSRRTTREKVLSFLSLEAQKAGIKEFKIPYTRAELADYLAVDRSALSRELGAMQEDGIINYDKNLFIIS